MKQKDTTSKQLKEKQFIVKRALFNKCIFAAFIFTLATFAISAILFFVPIIWLAVTILIIALIQITIQGYMFYQLNYGFANLATIASYKNIWFFYLLTGNITGAIYTLLLIKKK